VDKIFSNISFICVMVGLAGLAGTWEQEVTDTQGIVTALVILAAGILAGIAAAHESGYMSRMRKEGTSHENRGTDRKTAV